MPKELMIDPTEARTRSCVEFAPIPADGVASYIHNSHYQSDRALEAISRAYGEMDAIEDLVAIQLAAEMEKVLIYTASQTRGGAVSENAVDDEIDRRAQGGSAITVTARRGARDPFNLSSAVVLTPRAAIADMKRDWKRAVPSFR